METSWMLIIRHENLNNDCNSHHRYVGAAWPTIMATMCQGYRIVINNGGDNKMGIYLLWVVTYVLEMDDNYQSKYYIGILFRNPWIILNMQALVLFTIFTANVIHICWFSVIWANFYPDCLFIHQSSHRFVIFVHVLHSILNV